MLIRTDYKKKIDNSEWVNERISEVFDDATDMLTENAVVFGGAVRDALAGQELKGDIDIVTNTQEYKEVMNRFQKNVKWIPYHNQLQSGVISALKTPGYMPDYKKLLPKLSNMRAFLHMNGCVAQVISMHTKEIYGVIRNVDIVCCGVMMSYDGQVFELIEGAYEDCVAKVLRLNKSKDITDISGTPNRIVKLVERGWKSLITSKQLDRAITRYKKSVAAQPKKLQRHTIRSSPMRVTRPYKDCGRTFKLSVEPPITIDGAGLKNSDSILLSNNFSVETLKILDTQSEVENSIRTTLYDTGPAPPKPLTLASLIPDSVLPENYNNEPDLWSQKEKYGTLQPTAEYKTFTFAGETSLTGFNHAQNTVSPAKNYERLPDTFKMVPDSIKSIERNDGNIPTQEIHSNTADGFGSSDSINTITAIINKAASAHVGIDGRYAEQRVHDMVRAPKRLFNQYMEDCKNLASGATFDSVKIAGPKTKQRHRRR